MSALNEYTYFKRCPCDECTITHMITCGIINPDALESSNTPQTFNFPHDPNRYVIDVTPPSMSSTTSSSGSSSPILVEHERLILPFDDCPEHFEWVTFYTRLKYSQLCVNHFMGSNFYLTHFDLCFSLTLIVLLEIQHS